MRQFHVVFHLRIKESGTLAFWTDNGCVIARNRKVIHSDWWGPHPPTRAEIDVQRGEGLRVAQWQSGGEWLWGAQLVDPEKEPRLRTPADLVHFYLGAVQERLRHPDGPPLKMCLSGGEPIRTIVGLYSMILNGYAPSKVILFGEHQWNQRARELFASAFPFAEFVSTQRLMEDVGDIGGSQLIEMTQHYWWVFKSLIQLFSPPEENCVMDDDVFILDRVDDALEAFERCDLVYSPDMYNWGQTYLETWGPCCFFPLCEGLPGGLAGYDYAGNPCSFASVAFAGLLEKPSGPVTLWLAPQILERKPEHQICPF